MVIAAHQPNYLPNLAFFSKMKQADLFIIITNLQFSKHEGWQQRHKIKGHQGDIWLTVPVLGGQNQHIKDVRINNGLNWRKKHRKTLEIVYAKSTGISFLPPISAVYQKNWHRLVDLNLELINVLKQILSIKTEVLLDEDVSGVKHELLINICKKHRADTYLSGVGAKTYLTPDRLKQMKKERIKHTFVNNNLTAQYPYSTIHYLLSLGKNWVENVI